MSVYSSRDVYPSEFDEPTYGESCYTCNNDCLGVYLGILKAGEYHE